MVPGVEAAYDRDGFGVRSPDTKPCAGLCSVLSEVATEMIIETDVTALIEQIEISIAEQ
jgi:hypothetical protein